MKRHPEVSGLIWPSTGRWKYLLSSALIWMMPQKPQLQYGKGLMELLKQPLCNPLSMAQQVITLCAATHKKMMDIPVEQIKEFQMQMLEYIQSVHPEIIREIEETKDLNDAVTEKILAAADEFKGKFQ